MKYWKKRKSINKTQERKDQRVRDRIFIGFLVASIIHHMIFERLIIGQDPRQLYFVHLLPLAIGIVALGIYRRKFLIDQWHYAETAGVRIFYIVFYITTGVIFSFTSIGLVARIAWQAVNVSVAADRPTEYIDCDVRHFYHGRHNSKVEVTFQNGFLGLDTNYGAIKPFLDKDPHDFKVVIKAQRGVWNYYVVKSWDVVSKK